MEVLIAILVPCIVCVVLYVKNEKLVKENQFFLRELYRIENQKNKTK